MRRSGKVMSIYLASSCGHTPCSLQKACLWGVIPWSTRGSSTCRPGASRPRSQPHRYGSQGTVPAPCSFCFAKPTPAPGTRCWALGLPIALAALAFQLLVFTALLATEQPEMSAASLSHGRLRGVMVYRSTQQLKEFETFFGKNSG